MVVGTHFHGNFRGFARCSPLISWKSFRKHAGSGRTYTIALRCVLYFWCFIRLQNWFSLEYEVVDLLYQHESNLSIKDNNGNTPLHLLALHGNMTRMCQLTLSADPDLVNARWFTLYKYLIQPEIWADGLLCTWPPGIELSQRHDGVTVMGIWK